MMIMWKHVSAGFGEELLLSLGVDVLVRCHAEDIIHHSAKTEAVYDEWVPSNDVFEKDLPFHSAKVEINGIVKKCFRNVTTNAAKNKSWRVLIKLNCVSDSSRAAAVTEFRLLTGHDCLCAHLFRF
ncbi:uncharacterized protein TNCV_2772611 [Trichonephila clavipes]|nr:uncharacterized protein TNCV_2772611 [Trichonephila clavipes]